MIRLGIVLAVLVGAVLWITGGSTGPRVVASFTDVRGLVEGAPVRMAGLEVGRVESVALGDDGLPRVELQLDTALHEGAAAAVRLASLSGEYNRYVALADGDGGELRDGAEITDTRAPVEFDEALQALGPRQREDARAVLRGLREATDDRGDALAATLERSGDALAGTADAVRQLDADRPALRSLVRASAQVMSSLDEAPLGDSAREVAGLLGETATRQQALRETVAALPGALDGADAALDATRAGVQPLRALVRAARPGVAELVGASQELDPLLADARPVLAQAAALAAHAPGDLRALRGLVAHAEPLLGDLGPVLERMGPMLDQTRVRLPDFFSFFSNWADFTSNYDANGHGARVGIVLGNPTSTLPAPFLREPGALEGEPWSDYEDSFVAR
jgi:phospholipid/cholesterol/gamma-HCH transport system substrate-binding protein